MPASNTQKQLWYQVCPIFLTGGSVSDIPGSMMGMMTILTPTASPGLGLPYNQNDLDNAFAAFNVIPGGQLVFQTIAKYPFANQAVGANAVISEPLTLSVIMDTPMRDANSWDLKHSVFTALKSTLDSHNNKGGTYTVATPAYTYFNMVLLSLTDNSRGGSSLPQNAWRFDFEKPLVALQDLESAMNTFMSKSTNKLPTDGKITGSSPVPAMAANPSNMMTWRTAAALSGGPPTLVNTRSGFNRNFPTMMNAGGFPFQGVS